jgi:hypothetical protein
MSPLRHALPALLLVSACQPLPEEPPRQGSLGPPSLALEPDAPLDRAPPVVRLRIAQAEPDLESASEVLVIEDELSDYHLGRILKRDLPQTLLDRVVPALAWTEPDAIVVAPGAPLTAGAVYSIASPDLGRIGTIQIEANPADAILARLWPPAESGAGSERVLYCAQGPIDFSAAEPELSPGAVGSSAWRDPDACISIAANARPPDGARLVPPPRLGQFALDPAPIEHRAHFPPPPALCTSGELALGPGCARVEDDRMIVRSRGEVSLWSVRTPATELLEIAPADAELVILGLLPSSSQAVDVVVFDLAGRELGATVVVQTGPPRARIVIDEVLANPLGPEPQQEWVELVNDGSIAVELGTLSLEDLGGATALPAGLLAPGERVLVAREDFVLDDGLDVPVAPATRLLRVASLGKNGLSNSGEPLVLRAADGSELSRFPALPKPKAGISSARRRPFDLDHDPDAFAHHGEPGASPGAPNEVP